MLAFVSAFAAVLFKTRLLRLQLTSLAWQQAADLLGYLRSVMSGHHLKKGMLVCRAANVGDSLLFDMRRNGRVVFLVSIA